LDILAGLLVVLQESREIRAMSRRLREQQSRLLAESSSALTALILQQLEMANLRLDIAKAGTASAEMHQRNLSHAGRTCDSVRAWLAAYRHTDGSLPALMAGLDALHERLVQMRR